MKSCLLTRSRIQCLDARKKNPKTSDFTVNLAEPESVEGRGGGLGIQVPSLPHTVATEQDGSESSPSQLQDTETDFIDWQ